MPDSQSIPEPDDKTIAKDRDSSVDLGADLRSDSCSDSSADSHSESGADSRSDSGSASAGLINTIEVDAVLNLEVDRMATGGPAIATAPDGRVTLVDDALPSESIRARVTAVHKNRLEAKCIEIVQPSPNRQEPPCSHVDEGCGGCDWQHVTPETQRQLRVDIVKDCLRRIAKVDDVVVRSGPQLPVGDYRTTVRAIVTEGRAGYRKRSTHESLSVASCETAHPLIEELLIDGRFGSASEVVLRAGANTGERMVVSYPNAQGVEVPDGVTVVGKDEIDAGRRPHYHEEIGGLRLQVSAESFFQCRPDGALMLATQVADDLAEHPGDLLDAYCGVGLFGALAGTGRRIIGVESSSSAAGDAVINYGPLATVIERRFERWEPSNVGVAVADPARSGLRREGCEKLAATNAEAIALVSCDPAAMARDVSFLAEYGYHTDHITVFDLFGHTSHVETVARMTRS